MIFGRYAPWSTHRPTFSRSGEPVMLAASGDEADENLSVRQWKGEAGKVTDWQIDFVKPKLTVIPLFVPEMVDRGANIELGFTSCRQRAVVLVLRLRSHLAAARHRMDEVGIAALWCLSGG
jgi:hypothetical protein